MRRRGPAAVAFGFALLAGGVPARGGGDAASEVAALARRALEDDAVDLRRFAEWAERNGLEKAALADWERLIAIAPDDALARKRLLYVRRGPAWIRDEASFAILAPTADSKPARAVEYATKRRHDVERPSSARHRDVAVRAFASGLTDAGLEQLRLAVTHDPGDVWSRLSLGFVPDPTDGWVDPALRARRVADAAADAEVRRLVAMSTRAVALPDVSPRSAAAGKDLSMWRLREWRLETDLPPEDAAQALEAAELAGRWFRSAFDIPPGEPVLPGEGTFVVLTTDDLYRRVIDATPGLTKTERKFAGGLGAFPLRHPDDKGPWEVVATRPDGPNAADVCLHYAIHFLAQARFHVEAQEAWLYEGLAAYGAVRLLGFHGSWCVRLEDTSAKAGMPTVPDDPAEWPEMVEGLVRLHDDFPLNGLVGVSINGLDGPMLVKSWSLLRWLLEQHPDEARAFLDAKRRGVETPKALRAATGLALDDLDEAWHFEVLLVGPE